MNSTANPEFNASHHERRDNYSINLSISHNYSLICTVSACAAKFYKCGSGGQLRSPKSDLQTGLEMSPVTPPYGLFVVTSLDDGDNDDDDDGIGSNR